MRLRPRPSPPHSYDDFRRLARRRLPRLVYDFVEGGADGEVTLRANHAAFDRVHFTARVRWWTSPSGIAGATVLGRRLEVPFICGPAGLARLVHRDGELAAARAAATAGTVFVISTASSYSIEEIAAVSDGPLWFQLYLWRSPDVVARLVDRAGAAGCEAMVLTVDVPVIGKRERDLRNGMMIPPRIGPAQALEALRRPRWLWHLASGPPVHFGSLLDLVPPNTDMAVDGRLHGPRAVRPLQDLGRRGLAARALGRAAAHQGGDERRRRPPLRRAGRRRRRSSPTTAAANSTACPPPSTCWVRSSTRSAARSR